MSDKAKNAIFHTVTDIVLILCGTWYLLFVARDTAPAWNSDTWTNLLVGVVALTTGIVSLIVQHRRRQRASRSSYFWLSSRTDH